MGALGDEVIAVVFDRGDHGFHRLFTEFLGAVLRALVEQLSCVGRLSSRCCASIDGGGQIMDRKTRHQLHSNKCARNDRTPSPNRLSTFVTGSRQGSSRTGSPARTM